MFPDTGPRIFNNKIDILKLSKHTLDHPSYYPACVFEVIMVEVVGSSYHLNHHYFE